MVLHTSAYSIRCLLSPFSTISRRFVIRTRVGDGFLDFCGLLIALAIERGGRVVRGPDSRLQRPGFKSVVRY